MVKVFWGVLAKVLLALFLARMADELRKKNLAIQCCC